MATSTASEPILRAASSPSDTDTMPRVRGTVSSRHKLGRVGQETGGSQGSRRGVLKRAGVLAPNAPGGSSTIGYRPENDVWELLG
jgi:hypothetical protein